MEAFRARSLINPPRLLSGLFEGQMQHTPKRPPWRPKLPSERKLVTVTLRILPQTIRDIEDAATREGVSEGEWKRMAITERLERQNAKRAADCAETTKEG